MLLLGESRWRGMKRRGEWVGVVAKVGDVVLVAKERLT